MFFDQSIRHFNFTFVNFSIYRAVNAFPVDDWAISSPAINQKDLLAETIQGIDKHVELLRKYHEHSHIHCWTNMFCITHAPGYMVDPFTRYDMTAKEYVRSDLRDSKMLLKFEHHGVYHKVSNMHIRIHLLHWYFYFNWCTSLDGRPRDAITNTDLKSRHTQQCKGRTSKTSIERRIS